MEDFGIKLLTDKIKWEYKPCEFMPVYSCDERYNAKLKEENAINQLIMDGYDEITLYMDKNRFYMQDFYRKFYELFKKHKIQKIFYDRRFN